MTPERFTALLDAYGGDANRWPEAERAAALAYLEHTPAAHAERDAALKLDALINRYPAPAPVIDVARLVARATAEAQEKPTAKILPFRSRATVKVWARGAALAAAGLAGFVIGFADQPTTLSDTPLEAFEAAQVEDALW